MPGQQQSKEVINYYDAIQLISLNNLLNLQADKPTDKEYDLNRIFRIYSKKYSTPLHVVRTLPIHDILTAYFDDLFEDLEPERLEEIRVDLLKSAADREKEKQTEDWDDSDIEEFLNKTTAEAVEIDKKIKEILDSGVKPLISQKADVPLGNPLLDTKPLPNIKMTFISPEEMERQLNRDSSLGLLD
jgi:hypothetical protein